MHESLKQCGSYCKDYNPQDQWMKMKTTSIFIFLLTLFVWFNSAVHSCFCPEALNTRAAEHTQCLLEAGDTCGDCGHTTTCCVSHRDIPMVITSVMSFSGACFLVAQCLTFLTRSHKTLEFDLLLVRDDRAPPWPTPYKHSQLLLI